jgi:hypothetical protein
MAQFSERTKEPLGLMMEAMKRRRLDPQMQHTVWRAAPLNQSVGAQIQAEMRCANFKPPLNARGSGV